MRIKVKYLAICFFALLLSCASKPVVVTDSTTEALRIDNRYEPGDSSIDTFLEPYRSDMNQQMGLVIGYCRQYMYRELPESPLTNWASDVMMRAGEQYLGIPMDIAVVNIGGLRCDIPEGPVTVGTIFRLMPFDNTLVVVSLTGSQVIDLCSDIAKRDGQGVSGLRFTIRNHQAENITIKGRPVDADKEYLVCTSNYLAEGNDNLPTLAKGTADNSMWPIRDILIGIVQKDSVIGAQLDGRITIAD